MIFLKVTINLINIKHCFSAQWNHYFTCLETLFTVVTFIATFIPLVTMAISILRAILIICNSSAAHKAYMIENGPIKIMWSYCSKYWGNALGCSVQKFIYVFTHRNSIVLKKWPVYHWVHIRPFNDGWTSGLTRRDRGKIASAICYKAMAKETWLRP